MERFDNVNELIRTTVFAQDQPKSILGDSVECLCQVDENKVKIAILFKALLLDLSGCEYDVHCSSPWSEATLTFWQNIF